MLGGGGIGIIRGRFFFEDFHVVEFILQMDADPPKLMHFDGLHFQAVDIHI